MGNAASKTGSSVEATTLIQIAPRLPPAICGAGDYATLLARQLRQFHQINTQFVALESEAPQVLPRDGFSVRRPASEPGTSLGRLLPVDASVSVLLHYSGYGYQRRGCPIWLLSALKAWRLANPNQRLCIMFHELYASGPPWRSAFWLRPIQSCLARRLLKLASHCFTNLCESAATLKKMVAPRKPCITILPVFSNIGEPNHLPAWDQRRPSMVIFGSAGWRQEVYSRHFLSLQRACRQWAISELIDIGPGAVQIPPSSLRISIKGFLPAEEVSRQMMAARAGFFTCPVACLAKSGILAAYAAHGLLPATHRTNNGQSADRLREGEHFLSADSTKMAPPQEVSRNAFSWYQGHRLAVQAEEYAMRLFPAKSPISSP